MLIDAIEQATLGTWSEPPYTNQIAFDSQADDKSDAQSEASDLFEKEHTPPASVRQSKKDKREQALASYLYEQEKGSKVDTAEDKDTEEEQRGNNDRRIIDNVRSYQQELFERAKDGNVIAVSVSYPVGLEEADIR